MRKLALSSIVAATTLTLAGVSNAAIVYDSNITTSSDGGFFSAPASVMQVITISGPDSLHTIKDFTILGIRWNTAVGTQAFFLDFYTNIDESPTSTNALATATLAGSVGFTIAQPATIPGSYNYSTGVLNVLVPSNKFAVVLSLTNATGTTFSTGLVPRYSTGTPATGSNDGFVYFDNNLDQTFTGAERTQLVGTSTNLAPTNLRMSINADLGNTVPEPTTLALLGAAGVMVLRRKRQA